MTNVHQEEDYFKEKPLKFLTFLLSVEAASATDSVHDNTFLIYFQNR